MGMVLPEVGEETSWTAVNREEYVLDMRLSGEKVDRQVEVDVPRIDLQIRENDSCSVPIRNGRIFHQLMRAVIPDAEACDAVLACCTQTVLAQPMRALHAALPENILVAESKLPLRVRVQLHSDGRVRVRVSKKLNLVRYSSMAFVPLRAVRFVVEYDSRAPSVFVGIS